MGLGVLRVDRFGAAAAVSQRRRAWFPGAAMERAGHRCRAESMCWVCAGWGRCVGGRRGGAWQRVQTAEWRLGSAGPTPSAVRVLGAGDIEM